MDKFNVDDILSCVKTEPMPGNSIAPPLVLNKLYTVEEITIDKAGNQHLHVGLISEYNYVRSYETKEELPDGDKKHWCHPSRFISTSIRKAI